MAIPLLSTKLHIPPLYPDEIARPTLMERLDAVRYKKIGLLSAPAGFGKTTLVAQWLKESQSQNKINKVSWLTLEESDSNPIIFWTYFIAGMQRVDPAIGQAARAALQSQTLDVDAFLISLINDLSSLELDLFVILDDYFRIDSPEIHRAFDFFIEHLPINIHLVLITREDPPLALSRLRARGQLVEIRASELRFSEFEADQFINGLLGLDIAKNDILSLLNRTEGWPTGLRLASISLRGETRRHEFIQAFSASHRYLADYLMDEVYHRMDESLRDFVIMTSFLRRFSPDLCQAVTGNPNSLLMIQRMEQMNLFLIALNNERTWYRYHRLFREFMQLRLTEINRQQTSILYQRAIQWNIEQGFHREALEYALESKDFEQTADLLEALSSEILNREGPAALLNWIATLPHNTFDQRPSLIVAKAWALTFDGRIEDAEKCISRANTIISDQEIKPNIKTIRGYINALRAHHLFFKGRTLECLDFAQQALRDLPADEYAIREQTAAFLGSGYRYLGQMHTAQEHLAMAIEICEKTGNVNMANISYGSLGDLYLELGLPRKAMQTYQLMLEFAEIHTGRKDIPFSGFAYIAMGRTLHEWNRLDDAKQHLAKGIALCREWRQAQTLAIGLIELALLEKDNRNFDAARKALQEARQITSLSDSQWGTAMVDAFEARLDLTRGNLVAAIAWAEKGNLSISDGPAPERYIEYATFVRVLISQHKERQALVLLDKLLEEFRKGGRNGRILEILIWKARAFLGLSEQQKAFQILTEAINIGKPENYIFSFVEAGSELISIIQMFPQSDYRDKLLAAFSSKADDSLKIEPASYALVEELNEREIEVLRGMAAGNSNQEIGDQLYLSVNTIRWYASQIYLKLEVNSRAAAVAKAIELRIL